MINTTGTFAGNPAGYTFKDLGPNSNKKLFKLFAGSKWWFAIKAPNKDVGAFEFTSGYYATTEKFLYFIPENIKVNLSATQDPLGTVIISVGDYPVKYKMSIDLETADLILNTLEGTATDDTWVKMVQIA